MNENALLASYKVSCKIARYKKPHTIGEELILPSASAVKEIMHGENFTKLRAISLLNDTVARRIGDTAEDVEQQHFEQIRDNLFLIQLDEATDSNKDAHLIAYVRFCERSSVLEELLFCKPLELKITAYNTWAQMGPGLTKKTRFSVQNWPYSSI